MLTHITKIYVGTLFFNSTYPTIDTQVPQIKHVALDMILFIVQFTVGIDNYLVIILNCISVYISVRIVEQ
jgi:hypothetical protein